MESKDVTTSVSTDRGNPVKLAFADISHESWREYEFPTGELVMETETVKELYLHIGSGGVSFGVGRDQHNRPVIIVKASHFGQITNGMELLTTVPTLFELGEMFTAAANGACFSEKEYVYAAKPLEPVAEGSGVCSPEGCGQEKS